MKLEQFKALVKHAGSSVTIIGQGEPGIGKSSILRQLAVELPTHNAAYIDCTLLDLGDFALPFTLPHPTEPEAKITSFAPSARFRAHEGAPVLIMLDEIGKAMRPVQNVLITLMLERRIGDMKLPEGSIVFGTTNLTTDGVGDKLEAHVRNRVCFVDVEKPDADQWMTWAMSNDVDPMVVAWVHEFPHALESYTDTVRANPYIYNPKQFQKAFVTPRSLEKASDIVKKRELLGRGIVREALAGVVGESAAADIEAFVNIGDQLPPMTRICEFPETTAIPESPAARCILVSRAVQTVTTANMPGWLTYLRRMPMEYQAMFCITAMKSTVSQDIVASSRGFITLVTENSWML